MPVAESRPRSLPKEGRKVTVGTGLMVGDGVCTVSRTGVVMISGGELSKRGPPKPNRARRC